MRLSLYVLFILAFVCAAFAKTKNNARTSEIEESSGITTIHKKKKKDRSTSSSSGVDKDSGSGADSLEMKTSDGSSTSDSKTRTKNTKYIPKSSEERRGWRKWHRKCNTCPQDMKKKWKDFTIKWICGGYQRARRSFKSTCMMEYRNCQDGTMFVKITNGRCKNETGKESFFHGDHFFYEYRVKMSYESTNSKASTSSESDHSRVSSD